MHFFSSPLLRDQLLGPCGLCIPTDCSSRTPNKGCLFAFSHFSPLSPPVCGSVSLIRCFAHCLAALEHPAVRGEGGLVRSSSAGISDVLVRPELLADVVWIDLILNEHHTCGTCNLLCKLGFISNMSLKLGGSIWAWGRDEVVAMQKASLGLNLGLLMSH